MADVVQNLEFVFTVDDKATPETSKITDSMEAMEATAVNSADSLAESLATSVDTLSTVIDELGSKLGTTVDELEEVNDVAEKSKGRLLSLSSSFAFLKRMAGGVSLGAAIGGGAALGMKGINGIFKLLSPLVDLVADVFGPALEALSGAFKSLFAPIKTALLDIVLDLLPGLAKAFTPLVKSVLKAVNTFGDFLTSDDSPIPELMKSMQEGFAQLEPVLTDIVGVLIDNVKTMLPIWVKLGSTLVKVIAPIIGTIMKGIGTLISSLGPFIGDLVAMFTPLLEEFGVMFNEIFGELLTAILPILKPLLDAVLALVKPLLPLLTALLKLEALGLVTIFKVLGPVLQYLAKLISFLANELGGALTPFIKEFSEWIETLVDDALPGINLMVANLEDFFDDAKKNFRSINRFFRALGRVIGDVASDIGDWFSELWEDLKDGWTAVENFFVKAVEVFSAIWDDPLGALTLAFTTAFESIFGSFETIVGKLEGAWSDFLDFLGLGEMEETINGVFKAMFAALMSPIETIKGVINDTIIDSINTILSAKIPVVGSTIGSIANVKRIPHLADGGIISGVEGQGGVLANIGEAGPEAVIPLRDDVLKNLLPEVNVSIDSASLSKAGLGSRETNNILSRIVDSQEVIKELLELIFLESRKGSTN